MNIDTIIYRLDEHNISASKTGTRVTIYDDATGQSYDYAKADARELLRALDANNRAKGTKEFAPSTTGEVYSRRAADTTPAR